MAARDQVALQQLYRLTSAHLFSVLLRMLRSGPTAEDALQDTFIKIWNKAASYRESSGLPLTWMTSIARYHALDMIRADNSARQRDTRYALDSGDNLSTAMISLEHDVMNSQLLVKCLQRLEPTAREMVIDAYCCGYTQSELSQRNKTPLGTVKSWIRRSLISLKECIDELS